MFTRRQSAPGRHRPRRADAFTLLDCMIACGMLATALGLVFQVSSQSMQTLRLSKEEMAASQVLQQRIEQLRIANWQHVTEKTWLRDNILNVAADGAFALDQLQETVTITPYNSASTSSNVFTRANYLASAGTANTSLLFETTLMIKWTLDWKGFPLSRPHKRESVILLAKGGVAK